ncbi:tellurite resistance TerB family protein [Methylobacterium sp. ID0610]|uniref:tellurite resistance TerB family protein n=1 Tax=Methylobacterium carpenticola TaxID=3344827 RepID=UPI0036A21CA5
MLDAKRLLDQFLGGQGRGGYGQPPQAAPSPRAAPSPLDQIARSLGGQGSKVAVLGSLAALVLGSRKGHRASGAPFGQAGRIGGLAMVASLAYQAYQHWQAGRPPAGSAPAAAPRRSGSFLPSAEEAAAMLRGTAFQPASALDEQVLARSLLTAMISAAKADGHIDGQEQARIFGEMDRHALDADDKAFLMDVLRAPLDIDAVARLARSPEEAAEIYAASLMAIDVDSAPERAYLDDLARRLRLDPGLVRHIEETVTRAVREI